jgi:hypothetical protein
MKLLAYALFISSLAFGQTFQGSLRGRVRDPHGAAATRSKITVVDEATSVTRTTVTNDQAHLLHHVGGSYSFPAGCNFENGLVTRFLST